MPAGTTTTTTLQDSLPCIRQSARIVTEQMGMVTQAVEHISLENNVGLDWNEIALAKINAQAITENTCLDNPQRLCDTLFQVRPTMIGLQTVITDRVMMRISSNVAAQIGQLNGNAITRKTEQDGHAILDGAATSLGGGACSPLDASELVAAAVRIDAASDAPLTRTRRAILHPFAIHDIWSEIVGIASANKGCSGQVVDLDSNFTDRTFQNRRVRMVGDVEILSDGLLSNACCESKGGVFAPCGIVYVTGRADRVTTERKESLGGGSEVLYHYREYAFGERAAGSRLFEIHTDATAPCG